MNTNTKDADICRTSKKIVTNLTNKIVHTINLKSQKMSLNFSILYLRLIVFQNNKDIKQILHH